MLCTLRAVLVLIALSAITVLGQLPKVREGKNCTYVIDIEGTWSSGAQNVHTGLVRVELTRNFTTRSSCSLLCQRRLAYHTASASQMTRARRASLRCQDSCTNPTVRIC